MSQLIETKLIVWFSFILGLAICTATSVLSISYAAIALLVLFTANFYSNIKLALRNYFVMGGLLFYLVFLCAVVWTQAPFHDVWAMLLRIIGYLLLPLFFIAFNFNRCATMLLRGFLLGAMLSCVLSILSFLFNHPILYGIKDHTWVVFHGHILHSTFLAIAANVCFSGVLGHSLTRRAKIWYLLGYLLCFIDVMFIVNGRTGQLTFLLISIFLVTYRFKFKGIALLAVMSIVIGPLLYFSPVIQKGVQDYYSDTHKYENNDPMTSVGLRYEFHAKSIELIKNAWVIGYGTGSLKTVYQKYTNFVGNRATANPHNDWLWIGVETGILGIAAYVLFLFLTVLSLNKLQADYKRIGYVVLLAYLPAGVHNSFFIDNVTSIAFLTIMTAIIIAGNKAIAVSEEKCSIA